MLHRLAISLALAFSLTLAPGCSSIAQINAVAGPTGTIASVAPEVMNKAKQALTAAHNIHKSTAVFLTIAADSNLCTGKCASQAKIYLVTSHEALIAADRLVALGDAPGINAKIVAATALLASAQALVGKN